MDEELKGIVSKMIDNGENQAAIDFVISEYQSKKKNGGEKSTPKPLANTPSPFPAPSELEKGNTFSNPFRNTDDNGEHTVFEPNADWQGEHQPVPIQAKTIPITPYQDSKSYVASLQKRVLLGQTTPQDKAVLAQNKRAEYVDAEDEDYVGGIATELNPAAAGIKFGEQFKTVDEKLAAVDRLSKQVVDNFQKYNKRGEGDRERAADLDEATAGKVQQLQAIKGKLIKEKGLTDTYPIWEQATVSYDPGSNWLDRMKEAAVKMNVTAWAVNKVGNAILGVEDAPIVEKKLKQMPAAFSVGMNQLRYSDPEVFKRYTNNLKDGKQIAEADVAAITSDGLKALSDAAKFDLANGKITPEEYGTKVKLLKTENQKNLLDNPETLYSLLSDGIAQVADENNRISEAGATGLEVQKNAIFGHKWNYSDEEIDYYGKMVARDYGLDYNDGRIKAALSKLKTNENWIPFANSVAKSGYGRDLVKGAAPVVKGLYNYFDNMGMDDDARFAEGRSEGNREVFNKRLKSIQDDPVKNAVSTVFEGVGQLAAQAGLAYLGGEIIGAAGGMIAGDVATTAGQVVGTGARFGTGLIRSKEMLSTVTTTYIQEYDGNLKTAMNYTSDDSKARAVASSMSMLDAGLETILSPLDIAKGIGKSFYSKKKLASSILDILDDATVTNKAVAIKKAMAAATGNALKVVAGEVSEEVPAAVYDYAINGLLNPGSQRFKDRNEAKEVVQTIQQTALTMVVPALLSGVGAYKVNNFSKGTLLIAGQNRQKMIDMLVESKENGDITEAEFNEKAAIVNTAATANNQTPIKENGKPLDTREKADYVYSRVAESILMKQLKALKEDESRTVQPTATERTADGKPKEQVVDPEITMLEKKIEKLRDDRASILSLKPTYIVDGEKVDKKTINDIIKSNTADKYDEITVHNDNATQQKLRDIGGKDVEKKDGTTIQAVVEQPIVAEKITTQPIATATETIADPFDALFEEDKPIVQAEQITQPQAAATPTMQDRLAIARNKAAQPIIEDGKILPQKSKMEVVPVKLEPVIQPEVKTVPNDLGSGIEVKKAVEQSLKETPKSETPINETPTGEAGKPIQPATKNTEGQVDGMEGFDWDKLYAEPTAEEKLAKENVEKEAEGKKQVVKNQITNTQTGIDKAIAKKEAELKDWQGRKYKGNSDVVYKGGDDIHGEGMSIGGINEAKRQKRIRGIQDEIAALQKAKELISNYDIERGDISENLRNDIKNEDYKRKGKRMSYRDEAILDDAYDKALKLLKQNEPTPNQVNKPIQPITAEPKEQGVKEAVSEGADGVGQGNAETTTTILKENDLTLQNKTEKDANDIITGKKVFERFSPAEQRGIAKGGEIHAEATVLLGRNAESGISIEGQEKIIEDYAKQKGVWFEENNIGDKNYKSADVILTEQNGEPISSYLKKESQEAIVWRSPDGENVIKAQNTEMYGGDLQQKLDGITLQNTYFENEYPVKVIGFGRDSEGNFNVIIEQKFVEAGKDDIEKSGDPAYRKQKAEKVSNYIQSIGFDKDLSNDQYTDGFTIIEDVHNQNAIVKDNGQIVIFDPIMRLNTPEQGYGGKRELSNKITETATVLKDLENKEIPERTTLLMKEVDKIKGLRSNKIKAKAIEALSTRQNNPSKKEFKYTPEEVKDALDISTNFEKDNEDILTKECPT